MQQAVRIVAMVGTVVSLLMVANVVQAAEVDKKTKDYSHTNFIIEGALHWGMLHPNGNAGKKHSDVGANFGLYYMVYPRLYLDFSLYYQRNGKDLPGDEEGTFREINQNRVTPALGIAFRFDELPIYPEGKVLLGLEAIDSEGSWNIDGSLIMSFGLVFRVGGGVSLGINVNQHLSLSELADDPGVFLELFKSSARYRTFGLVIRWEPHLVDWGSK